MCVLLLLLLLAPASAWAAWSSDVQPRKDTLNLLGGHTEGKAGRPAQRGAVITPARCSDSRYGSQEGQCRRSGATWIPEVREPDIPAVEAVPASSSGIYELRSMLMVAIPALLVSPLLWLGLSTMNRVLLAFELGDRIAGRRRG